MSEQPKGTKSKDKKSFLSQKAELSDRWEAEKKRLEARIAELKGDTRDRARQERDKLEVRMAELKESVSRGWDNITEAAAEKINKLLERRD